ncbi:short-chain dehydrogenase/reductase (oxidoreductase) [Paraphaeosphaeria minitans]|uniref:Short-chain dehydrogenase/reductase (Oxidoreductase) n=1 Tax=Paraphaeosphaeria minitans TaxID=565426 RepID=A0A9P6KQK5_9PLEO|nr:short-chain dehydrogenase/reductase (oxidoreductase) [Paraphaeosphaeria minitans]
MERTVVVTGASSGLGLAFLKHYAAQPSTRVVGLDISPLPASISSQQNVSFYEVDVATEESLAKVADDLRGQTVHILILLTQPKVIHSAGIRGLVPSAKHHEQDVAALETLHAMERTTFLRTLEINTWGAFATVRSFLPALQLAASSAACTSPPKIIVMSSRMGSIAANVAGGGYAYRASKAALNAVIKSFAIDVPGVVVLAMHPGRVETGLVGWNEEGAISPEESLGTSVQFIETVGIEGSGRFVDRFGEGIAW